MKRITDTQGDESWRLARLGIPTASNADALLTPKERKLSAKRSTYMAQLVSEWALGREVLSDNGTGGFMGRGTGLEAEAIAWLEFDQGVDVERVGFCTLDDDSFGWSLDGWVPAHGRTVECKAPGPKQHIANLLDPDAFVASHFGQVQSGLMGSEGESAWLLSYHPSLPKLLRLVPRDEAYITAFRAALATFTAELHAARARLLMLPGWTPATTQPLEPALAGAEEF